MGIVARLQDVEQQLSRVTGVVQLHVKLTASSLAVDMGNVETREEVLALVGTVERVQGKLQTVTEQLLTLIKQSLEGTSIGEKGGDTYSSTEDFEMGEVNEEEPPISVKIEKCEEDVAVVDNTSGENQAALMESFVDEVVAMEDVVQVKDELQEVVDDPRRFFSICSWSKCCCQSIGNERLRKKC